MRALSMMEDEGRRPASIRLSSFVLRHLHMRHSMLPTISEIEAARARIRGAAIRTPLVRLNVDDAAAEIYLKLENLQPIGSFKLRGAANAIGLATPEQLAKGVYTCSAGNMAQGVAWNARRLGISSTAVVPDHAPETK